MAKIKSMLCVNLSENFLISLLIFLLFSKVRSTLVCMYTHTHTHSLTPSYYVKHTVFWHLELFCVFFPDVTGWFSCSCCAAAWWSVSGSGCDPVCTVISHSVPSGAKYTCKTGCFSQLCIYFIFKWTFCLNCFYIIIDHLLSRPWVQTVKTHRIHQTVEQQLKKPEKYWRGGLHIGKENKQTKRNWKPSSCLINNNSGTVIFSHYRKILNDLSAEEVAHIEGKDSSPTSTGVTGVTVPTTPIYQTSSGQYSKSFSLRLYLKGEPTKSFSLTCEIKNCEIKNCLEM